MSMQAALLPDGKRLHLQHGPIDLIIGVEAEKPEMRRCFMAAHARFETVLPVLVEELHLLRTEISRNGLALSGPVARRMERAVRPHWRACVTPMAAVAGAVADEVLAAMLKAASPGKAYVNNGGDIAFHLAPGESFSIASANGPIAVRAADPVRAIATSGWRGRSHSLGIADSVTVLAGNAAQADVAATLIANAVDLPVSAKITRAPASSLSDDSDLGERLVTVDVAPLSPSETEAALASGIACASSMQARGLVHAATLGLNGTIQQTGPHNVPAREAAHA